MFGFFSHLEISLKSMEQNPRNHNHTKAHAKVDHIWKQNLTHSTNSRSQEDSLGEHRPAPRVLKQSKHEFWQGCKGDVISVRFGNGMKLKTFIALMTMLFIRRLYERLVVFLQGTKQFSNETDFKNDGNWYYSFHYTDIFILFDIHKSSTHHSKFLDARSSYQEKQCS